MVDACNAIAYAHSRGVLHRNLKPGVIMSGSFGETQVMGWGLVMLLDKPDGVVTSLGGMSKRSLAA